MRRIDIPRGNHRPITLALLAALVLSGGWVDAASPPVIAGPTVKNGSIVSLSNRQGQGSFYDLYAIAPKGELGRRGKKPTRLTEIGFAAGAALSPDGTRVAFVIGYAELSELYVVDVSGANLTQLTNNAALDERPAWSPDGDRIAFTSDRDDAAGWGEIFVMDADGSDPTNLTSSVGVLEIGSAWSPDGNKIAFQSFRDGYGEIYVMDADGANQTNLTNDPAGAGSPAWSPDGGKIAFVSDRARPGIVSIWVMDADGSNPTQITRSYDLGPVWSPDGAEIAFYRRGDVHTVDADGGAVKRLTERGRSRPITWLVKE